MQERPNLVTVSWLPARTLAEPVCCLLPAQQGPMGCPWIQAEHASSRHAGRALEPSAHARILHPTLPYPSLQRMRAHFIWRRMSLSPLWKGMWKNSHILGSSAHARIRRSVKYLRARLQGSIGVG